jgi:hypothetical protein
VSAALAVAAIIVRHRDDAEPRRQALARGTVTTTPPP